MATTSAKRQHIFVWGYNGHCKLGMFSNVVNNTSILEEKALPIFHKIKFATIATLFESSLALTTEGELFGWGDNSRGELGLGHKKPVKEITRIPFFYDIEVSQIACGARHSLVMTKKGVLYAFGQSTDGCIGSKVVGGAATVPTIVLVKGDVNITKIAAGSVHNVLLTDQGKVLTFGSNSNGQLGHPNVGKSETPMLLNFPGGEKIANVFAQNHSFHTFAISTNGKVFGWGNNMYNQLGANLESQHYVRSPTEVTALSALNVQTILVGQYHTVALTKSNAVYVFGANDEGQLGLGYFCREIEGPRLRSDLVLVKPTERIAERIPGAIYFTQMYCGGSHIMLITDAGRLMSTGWNEDGQLGDGTTTSRNTFVETQVLRTKRPTRLIISLSQCFGLIEEDVPYPFAKNVFTDLVIKT